MEYVVSVVDRTNDQVCFDYGAWVDDCNFVTANTMVFPTP